jgi:hypothetical protein
LASNKGVSLLVHSNARVTDIQRTGGAEKQMRIMWTNLSVDHHDGEDVVVDAALLCTGQ